MNREAAHGVASAVYSINVAGGSVNATYKSVGYDSSEAIRAALELMQEERVHAVVGGGLSKISAIAQNTFSLASVPQVSHSSTCASIIELT